MRSARPTPLAPPRLRRLLAALRQRRVAVLGDVILDVFLWGDAERISPEAPVPVVRLERQSYALGGAANVAANIAGLGGRPLLLSALSEDAAGERLRQLARRQGLDPEALLVLPARRTSTKFRVFARNKHMLRCDRETTAPIPTATTRALLARLGAEPCLDAVVVSDYAKGVVTRELISGVARLCAFRRIPWCVDPKQPALCYRHATLLKPNQREMESLAGFAIASPTDLRRAAAKLLRRHQCDHLLVTLGAQGIVWFSATGGEQFFPGSGRGVADVTGAGDTVSAIAALGLAARLPLDAIAPLANLAGAYVVSQPGLAIASPGAVLAQLT